MTSILNSGPETLVPDLTANSQESPAVATLANGSYVIVWQSFGADGSLSGISYQLRSPTGEKISVERIANTYVADTQYDPQVCGLADGGFVICWTSANQDTPDSWGIYAQRFDASGLAVGVESRVNTTTANYQTGPSLAALSDGGYVVAWESFLQDGSSYGVYAQRYDAWGVRVGGETRANTTTYTEQGTPAVCGLADGGYVVTWTSYDQDGSFSGIYAQRYNSDGVAIGEETPVNTYTLDAQFASDIAALDNGGYVIVWTSFGQDGSEYAIVFRRFGADGQATGPEILANSYVTQGQYFPRIAGLNDGGFVITWVSYGQDGEYSGVYLQRFDALGQAIGPESLVNTDTLGEQSSPAVSALANGGFVVTWTGTDSGGASTGILQKTFYDASGNMMGSQKLFGTIVDDVLDGGAGPDQMYGGGGNDTYVVDNIGDRAFEIANGLDTGGVDTVQASANFALGANIEVLTLTGTGNINGSGNGLDNTINGNGGDNVLRGNDGNDIINANVGNDWIDGGVGADKMYGGSGNDRYVMDDLRDRAIETANANGTDTVQSSVSYILGAFLENLTLTGAAAINGAGNTLSNVLTGNDGVNTLTGYAGNDRLDGGAGADILYGGANNDTYIVDVAGDKVSEVSGGVDNGGVDTINASVTFTAPVYVEILVLTGTGNISGSGNADNNIMVGNSSTNVLLGLGGNDFLDGGEGADTMYGASGNDTYVVDNSSDVVSEVTGGVDAGGIDTVNAKISYILGNYIENLTLVGSDPINGTGNAVANVLIGNADNNTLNGAGGADSLTGGLGADVFLFLGGSGADTITDFKAVDGDRLNLRAYNIATTVITQVDATTVTIDLGGGNTVTLQNTLVADLKDHIDW